MKLFTHLVLIGYSFGYQSRFKNPDYFRYSQLDNYPIIFEKAKVFFGHEIGHSLNEIKDDLLDSTPVLLLNVDSHQKDKVGIPISHGGYSSHSKALLFDSFKDINNATYFRLINVPVGAQNRITKVNNEVGNLSFLETSSFVEREEFSIFEEFLKEVSEYLEYCGGNHNVVNFGDCWSFMSSSLTDSNNMIPEKGAVWREYIETTFMQSTSEAYNNLPFQPQKMIHRLNIYWYIYLQAPPHTQLYYVFAMVDGMHKANIQLTRE